MNILEIFGSMPYRNLHTTESATAAKCLLNRAEHCVAEKCMAWRWLRIDGKPVLQAHEELTDENGPLMVGVGWCGMAAYPLIGERPS